MGDHVLTVSSLDKVLYPETGTTKRDVLAYVAEIAEVMLPHCRDRAATRKRWPNGVGDDGAGVSFFQKDIGDGAPDWVALRAVQHSDHVNEYPLVNDMATLAWLAQLSTLEIHVPQWRFGADGTALNPDRLVLDLDPGPGVGLRECAEVAFLARRILSDMGLESCPVTSGSKGVHLYVALDGSHTSDQVSAIAKELARSLEADHPDDITSSMKRDRRPGKVFIDWSQNRASKTTIAPYSLRGRTIPMVAAPRTWHELASPHLKHLEYREVLRRVRRRGDPMADFGREPSDEGEVPDRLAEYRAKRDALKTPEPVPAASPRAREASTGARAFVIQRHEARRLHYDFRLEHDGVLVSWALPKGVPTDPKVNRLAVPTEDHPLDYQFFEGTIPAGEYGAGEMTIWDTGTVQIEKWEEDEVIATLTGRAGGGLGGTRTFALFRTQNDPQRPQWMIHLMEDRRKPRAPRVTAPLRPMLATKSSPAEITGLPADDWSFEMKWDGMRALVSVDASTVRVRSRSGADVTDAYPELAGLAKAVSTSSCVIDGEIIARDRSGRPNFSLLQQRMNVADAREVARLRDDVPVSFMAFDVLEINGLDCTSLPYRERREFLRDIVDTSDLIDVPPAFDGDAEAALEASRDLELEGIIAKRQDSPYRTGARSRDWLKLPHADTAEVVVIGWRRSENDPSSIASLLVAVPTADGFEYAGRVGTGFSTKERAEILRQLRPAERTTAPIEVPPSIRRDAHWVAPKRVGEITYRERTPSGSFRQPVWRGWRPDRSARDLAPT